MEFKIDWGKLSLGFILGYLISLAYFLITLPIFISWLGKLNGTIVNYGISWLVWILITVVLEFRDVQNLYFRPAGISNRH
jgi:hypothetical protein